MIDGESLAGLAPRPGLRAQLRLPRLAGAQATVILHHLDRDGGWHLEFQNGTATRELLGFVAGFAADQPRMAAE